MTRLIDADALHESIDTETYRHTYIEQIHSIIDNAPTIDAEPVKHGKWKYYNYSDINNPYVGLYECTVCKQHEYSVRKYCPNCGAKMDKE